MIYVYLQFFLNRNLITMERIILLSFNSTDNDDCGLPYLCSNSGCNETLLSYQQSSHKELLKPFSASEAPHTMAESTEDSHVLSKNITCGEMDLILGTAKSKT